MSKICNVGKSYGLTVRVPWSTKKFEQLHKGRTAVERVNARLKVFWGADDGNVTGSRRFFALLGIVLVVHAAFATLLAAAPRREGTLRQTRLSPIAKALRGKLKPSAPKRRRRPARRERQERLRRPIEDFPGRLVLSVECNHQPQGASPRFLSIVAQTGRLRVPANFRTVFQSFVDLLLSN